MTTNKKNKVKELEGKIKEYTEKIRKEIEKIQSNCEHKNTERWYDYEGRNEKCKDCDKYLR